jgi:hypothetical protein
MGSIGGGRNASKNLEYDHSRSRGVLTLERNAKLVGGGSGRHNLSLHELARGNNEADRNE